METAIVVHPTNNSILLGGWNDDRQGAIYGKVGYAFSTDGGNNWSEGILQVSDNLPYSGDPSVSFDRNGRAYFGFMAFQSGPGGYIYIAKKENLEQDWTYHQVNTNDKCDKPFIAVDDRVTNGRIYVAWTRIYSDIEGTIEFAYSVNQAESFTTITPSLDSYEGDDLTIGAVPAIGPNGEVYVVWMYTSNKRQQGASGEIRIRKSTNGGETFGNIISVASNI